MIFDEKMNVKVINNLCGRKLGHREYDIRCYLSGQIKLQLKNLEDYQLMQKNLVDLEVKFHTNVIASEQPLKLVIKGVPPNMENEEIKEDLIS